MIAHTEPRLRSVATSTFLSGRGLLLQRKCACGGSAVLTGACSRCESQRLLGNAVQTKLRINEPGDEYEQEADRVAKNVLHMPDSRMNEEHSPLRGTPLVQRTRTKNNTGAGEVPAIVHDALSSPGQALDADTRAFFEPRFGHDFSRVRVHADAKAAASARAVNAIAYSVGQHIAFAPNFYAPGTARGQELLAHELTHVVQQGSLNDSKIGTLRRRSDPYYESMSGVDKGLSSQPPTLVPDVLMGFGLVASCGNNNDCLIVFEFPKAYTGAYPYAKAGGRMLRGVYVKITAEWAGNCGSCKKLLLIQTVRHSRKGTQGIEADERGGPREQQRSGWNERNAASRGWRIDTPSGEDPYYTNPRLDIGIEGTPNRAAVLWDSPGDDITLVDAGKEFQTCAVCDNGSGGRQVLACVGWGYFIDSQGAVKFQPATPTQSCGPTEELKNAATRWNALPGNQPAGITF